MADFLKKFNLTNKTALVAGGCGLLGKQIVLALAQAGAKVIACDIDKRGGAMLEKALKKRKLKVHFEYFDTNDYEHMEKNLNAIARKYRKFHIFVNCSYPRTSDWNKECEDVTASSWRKNLDMHLNSYCLLSKIVAKIMRKRKIKGTIINLASIYGITAPDFAIYKGMPFTMPAAYSAIKGGIISFTQYLASYYGKDNIRANCISPGGVFDKQPEKFVKRYIERTPLRRMAMAEDLGGAAIYLASDASSYVSGHNLVVDGGWTIK